MARVYGYFFMLALLMGAFIPAYSQFSPLRGPLGRGPGGSSFKPTPQLFVTHAAIDPTNGDLLIVSNAWPHESLRLRRFNQDGKAKRDFVLQRFESCCSIEPSLVAVDQHGNIYTLQYKDSLGGFSIYKHSASGELHIDWGFGGDNTEVLSSKLSTKDDNAGGSEGNNTGRASGYEGGETFLNRVAGGGHINFPFLNPVDVIPKSDGSLLVLDQALMMVYKVDPQGRSVTEFIGAKGYYPKNPFRLIMDSDENLYLLDYYDLKDIIHEGMVGVFKFAADGSWIEGWGEGSGFINDRFRPTIDFNTLIVDGSGVLLALGGDFADANHGVVFSFDRESGERLSRNSVEYLLGYDENYLGILGRKDEGFILLEARDFMIEVNYYSRTGKREKQVLIKELYPVE